MMLSAIFRRLVALLAPPHAYRSRGASPHNYPTLSNDTDVRGGTLYEAQIIHHLEAKELPRYGGITDAVRLVYGQEAPASLRDFLAEFGKKFPDAKLPRTATTAEVKPDAVCLAGNTADVAEVLAECTARVVFMNPANRDDFDCVRLADGTEAFRSKLAAALSRRLGDPDGKGIFWLLEISKGPSAWLKKVYQLERALLAPQPASHPSAVRLPMILLNENEAEFDRSLDGLRDLLPQLPDTSSLRTCRVLVVGFAPFRNMFSEMASIREDIHTMQGKMETMATKDDIAALAATTKADIAALAATTKADIAALAAQIQPPAPVLPAYWVAPRDGDGAAFKVKPEEPDVASLKKAIKAEMSPELDDVAAARLSIYASATDGTPLDAKAELADGVEYLFARPKPEGAT